MEIDYRIQSSDEAVTITLSKGGVLEMTSEELRRFAVELVSRKLRIVFEPQQKEQAPTQPAYHGEIGGEA